MSVVTLPLALSLLALPGAWLAFGLPLRGSTVRARVALAVVLSPLVAVAQFYLLRLVGLPFERVAWMLALVNLPALALVARRRRDLRWPRPRAALLWLALLLLPALYLAVWQGDPQVRANWGHAWTHTDIVYLLANGELRPEEPQLAGLRLSYPWLGHVHQGVVSWLLDAAPNATYLLTNCVWLLAAIVLVAEVVARLGGGLFAQAASAAWLCFALNVAGLLAQRLVPLALARRYPVWGDERYTPWLRKFGVFEQTTLGIALCGALLYALTRVPAEDDDPSPLILVLLLLLSTATLYPLLFPVGAALVGARLLTLGARRLRAPAAVRTSTLAALAASLVAAAVVTGGYLALLGTDRVGEPSILLSRPYQMKVKAVSAVVALAPLLGGVALAGRRLWRAESEIVALLGMGTLASVGLNVVFDVRYWANEYKYMFTAALFLAPFPAIALSRGTTARWSGAVAVALAAALTIAWAPRADRELIRTRAPLLRLDEFSVRLAPSESLAAVTDAIRERSAPGAALVSRASPFDLVTLTRRPLYVPVDTVLLHGIGLTPDFLLKKSRGYDPALVETRRARVRALYEAGDAPARERALAEIARELGRPVVLLARRHQDSSLAAWLRTRPGTRALFASRDHAAWEVDAPGAPPPATHASRP